MGQTCSNGTVMKVTTLQSEKDSGGSSSTVRTCSHGRTEMRGQPGQVQRVEDNQDRTVLLIPVHCSSETAAVEIARIGEPWQYSKKRDGHGSTVMTVTGRTEQPP
jgi:hypothetical protein